MAAIILQDKWRRQPSGPVSVDWNNPLARGLVLAYVPTVPYNAARNTPAIVAPTLAPTSDGIALAGNGSTSYLKLAATPTLITGSYSSYSISALGAEWANSNAISQGVAFSETWAVRYYYGGGTRYVWASGVGNDVPAGSGASGISRVGISVASGVSSGAKVFWNGALAITTTGTPPALSGSRSILVGRSEGVDGVTHQAANNNIILSLAWNRPLSADEMQEADKSPYAIFRKQPRILYFTAPSGGGATIAGDSGTYALTGSDVSLKAGRKLAADSGSYSLTGTDVSLKLGRSLTAESGTYTVNGTDVSLTVGRKLAADSGAYALTGTDVTLTYQPAGGYTLAADSGSYTLTGTAATLKASRKLTADSGTYTLTGTDVTLTRGFKITADSGTYTLTGSSVAFARTYVLGADSGSYTLTGSDVGLTWSGAPVVDIPTHGGPSIYGKAVFREAEFKREYEREVSRIEAERFRARQIREDEELVIIMAALAA